MSNAKDADGRVIQVGDVVEVVEDCHYGGLDGVKELKVTGVDRIFVYFDHNTDDGHCGWRFRVIQRDTQPTEQTMSKPGFVPDSALFYATDGVHGVNILYADPNASADILDVWIENSNDCLVVGLSRERARKVAQEILKWVHSEKPGPVEI